MRKTGTVKKVLTVVMSLGILMAGAAAPKAVLRMKAAEPVTVTDLKVVAAADGTGVAAQCSYRNYDSQSGCEIRLYLYRLEPSNTFTIVSQKKLSYAVQGIGNTDYVQVSDGTYFASASMDYSGSVEQINSPNYFKVRQVDGEYIVTQEMDTQKKDAHNSSGAGKKRSKGKEEKTEPVFPVCDHVLEYFPAKQATPESDSVLAYQCTVCGEVIQYLEVPNSAYAAFLMEAADTVRNTLAGEAVISTERWMSFDQSVLEAIAQRPDLSVTVNYKYQGINYTVTIPAGTDVKQLADENGFCGFLYLDSVFNGMEVSKLN